LKRTLHFINLTNGIQAIKDYNLKNYRFMRLQSTLCEQKRWDHITKGLSEDLLLNLALGNNCIIYDYGANRQVPRAIWQGVEWIKFILNKRWFNNDYVPEGRMRGGQGYFDEVYRNLSSTSMSKIKYFRKYLDTPDINLKFICSPTQKDSNVEYYRSLLLNITKNQNKSFFKGKHSRPQLIIKRGKFDGIDNTSNVKENRKRK
jgi:hypothetical protein